MINELLDRPALSPDEEDYLDVLGLLVADYEDSIYEHSEFTPWSGSDISWRSTP